MASKLGAAQTSALRQLFTDGKKDFAIGYEGSDRKPYDKLVQFGYASADMESGNYRMWIEYLPTESGLQLARELFADTQPDSTDTPSTSTPDGASAGDGEPATTLTDDLLTESRQGWNERMETLYAEDSELPFASFDETVPSDGFELNACVDGTWERVGISTDFAGVYAASKAWGQWTIIRTSDGTVIAQSQSSEPIITRSSQWRKLPVAETQPRYSATKTGNSRVNVGSDLNRVKNALGRQNGAKRQHVAVTLEHKTDAAKNWRNRRNLANAVAMPTPAITGHELLQQAGVLAFPVRQLTRKLETRGRAA